MERFKTFITTALIGGFAVILPVAILVVAFSFIIKVAGGLIDPFTQVLEGRYQLHRPWSDLIVLALILGLCFLVGLVVRTRYGHMLHRYIEQKFLEATPGYKMIKETTAQLMSGKQSPLSRVALVNPFNNDTLMTAFITFEHPDGSFTVFLPMAPPTSGFVFHLKASQVHPVDVSTQEAMKTFISLGAGSGEILEQFRKNAKASGEGA